MEKLQINESVNYDLKSVKLAKFYLFYNMFNIFHIGHFNVIMAIVSMTDRYGDEGVGAIMLILSLIFGTIDSVILYFCANMNIVKI